MSSDGIATRSSHEKYFFLSELIRHDLPSLIFVLSQAFDCQKSLCALKLAQDAKRDFYLITLIASASKHM
jgi:hypothetical protein